MNKISRGYGLVVLLYLGTVGLFLFSIGIPGWPWFWPILAIAFLALEVLAIYLFIWSIKEVKQGFVSLVGVIFLSALYLCFSLWGTTNLLRSFGFLPQNKYTQRDLPVQSVPKY